MKWGDIHVPQVIYNSSKTSKTLRFLVMLDDAVYCDDIYSLIGSTHYEPKLHSKFHYEPKLQPKLTEVYLPFIKTNNAIIK